MSDNTVKNVQTAFIITLVIWIVHLINIFYSYEFKYFGLRPRIMDGLWGILFSPFIHGGFKHLISNTPPLFILLVASLSFSRKMTLMAVIIIMVLGGGGVWVFGKPGTVHIGASGVIFGLIGYLICIGIFKRQWKAFIISLLVGIFYGGTLLSLFVYAEGISWSGHFWGFISGIAAAWMLRKID